MVYKAESLDWNVNAGRRLDELAHALPPQPRLEITVFGSAPLQLLVERSFLSEDIDVYCPEESQSFLERFVQEHGWGKGQTELYIQVCDARGFRSALDWRDRAIEAVRNGHLFRFVHPLDVLTSKLQRLEPKDMDAFRLVIAKTGRPTEEEFRRHLRKAVDLYRPKFDEESAQGDMLINTHLLWQALWNKDIDVRAEIIRPALEAARRDYDVRDDRLKQRLSNLRVPPKE